MSQHYFVKTFGCQMNVHDSERIAGILSEVGYEASNSIDTADVVVLNTCCIRENADNKLYGNLGHLSALKAERPGMKIVVAGCLAQKDKELVAKKAPYVDVVVGTFNLSSIPDLLSRADGSKAEMEFLDAPKEYDEVSSIAMKRESSISAWVSIQTGCNNSCAFCIVPSVRGKEVSRPFQDIVDEVRLLARSGVREVTLLGQNVNSYGRDITLSLRKGEIEGDLERWSGERWLLDPRPRVRPLFSDLLRAVGSVKGISRVRFTSPHPKDMVIETFEAMSETEAVCEQLHFPLQSGSDRVLSEMRRGYSSAKYLERLRLARSIVPDLAVSTDIIVGFPGESDEDFKDTLRVVEEANFDGAFTFIFSPRPGTRAAEMTQSFIDPEIVQTRFDALKEVVEVSALGKHEARVGRVEEVLVEGSSKRDSSVLSGRTRQNKLVHFVPPSDLELSEGDLIGVRIGSAAPHFLRGEVDRVISRPRVRQSIALKP
ncbi:tRNA (N6-isopentenyl adenosine(37)-C2)-methylthiotransferase MiaB [Ferrithrix thermotolerans]|nr:tRNA (N6-isopentenyl adenosine(37)-C2)-methylthiotransferase MiaB [Ferrithrix thermotolerans]